MRIVVWWTAGLGQSTYVEKLAVRRFPRMPWRGLLADDPTTRAFTLGCSGDAVPAAAAPGDSPAVTYVGRDAPDAARAGTLSPAGHLYGCPVEAVYFDVPLEVCRSETVAG